MKCTQQVSAEKVSLSPYSTADFQVLIQPLLSCIYFQTEGFIPMSPTTSYTVRRTYLHTTTTAPGLFLSWQPMSRMCSREEHTRQILPYSLRRMIFLNTRLKSTTGCSQQKKRIAWALISSAVRWVIMILMIPH